MLMKPKNVGVKSGRNVERGGSRATVRRLRGDRQQFTIQDPGCNPHPADQDDGYARRPRRRPDGPDRSGPVQYKGADLDAERGPGLGCFWIQAVALVIAMILAPLSAVLNWPAPIAIGLLFLVVILLLLVGQTAIFLLRLVAADRKSRRAPIRSATKTVGQLEDESMGDKGSGGVGESR